MFNGGCSMESQKQDSWVDRWSPPCTTSMIEKVSLEIPNEARDSAPRMRRYGSGNELQQVQWQTTFCCGSIGTSRDLRCIFPYRNKVDSTLRILRHIQLHRTHDSLCHQHNGRTVEVRTHIRKGKIRSLDVRRSIVSGDPWTAFLLVVPRMRIGGGFWTWRWDLRIHWTQWSKIFAGEGKFLSDEGLTSHSCVEKDCFRAPLAPFQCSLSERGRARNGYCWFFFLRYLEDVTPAQIGESSWPDADLLT